MVLFVILTHCCPTKTTERRIEISSPDNTTFHFVGHWMLCKSPTFVVLSWCCYCLFSSCKNVKSGATARHSRFCHAEAFTAVNPPTEHNNFKQARQFDQCFFYLSFCRCVGFSTSQHDGAKWWKLATTMGLLSFATCRQNQIYLSSKIQRLE